MVALHLVQGTTAGRTCVHVHIERFVVEAALVNRLVVVHRHLCGGGGKTLLVQSMGFCIMQMTHLDVVVHALVNGQTILVQTVRQRAQNVRVSRLLVAADDHYNHKDQQHNYGHKHSHQDTHIVVLWILIDRFRRNYCWGERDGVDEKHLVGKVSQ